MFVNIKKIVLVVVVIVVVISVLVLVFVCSEFIIVLDFYFIMVCNFNLYLVINLCIIIDFIYEFLVVFNEMKGNMFVFCLVESYKMVDDLMSVIFDICKGVKWFDGEVFIVDDVVYFFGLLKVKLEFD